jgi:hypothetical protein
MRLDCRRTWRVTSTGDRSPRSRSSSVTGGIGSRQRSGQASLDSLPTSRQTPSSLNWCKEITTSPLSASASSPEQASLVLGAAGDPSASAISPSVPRHPSAAADADNGGFPSKTGGAVAGAAVGAAVTGGVTAGSCRTASSLLSARTSTAIVAAAAATTPAGNTHQIRRSAPGCPRPARLPSPPAAGQLPAPVRSRRAAARPSPVSTWSIGTSRGYSSRKKSSKTRASTSASTITPLTPRSDGPG